jgi:hypothetical protein
MGTYEQKSPSLSLVLHSVNLLLFLGRSHLEETFPWGWLQ